MKKSTLLFACSLFLGGLPTVHAGNALPHLEQRGAATQLIVDGQPWLIRGGELANTASSSLPYMDQVWPELSRLNLNTVLVSIAWAWVEPEEGKFDFTLVDGLLADARKNNQRIVFIWFGSWKNSISSFAPPWVKVDQARFPRVQLASGTSLEILSAFSDAALQADTRAYVKFLEHLKQVDAPHTTLMIQLQNEVGILGASRDQSAVAKAAFGEAVPRELLDALAKRKSQLSPALAKLQADAGGKNSGTWTDVFGATPATDEIFMAWHYARFLGHMAAAGKAVYALPVFTNTWIVQPEDKVPGDYPSGGPQPLTFDIWRAGAPAIDLNCPDIYLPNFDVQVAAFHRPDNPLFVPESRGDAAGVANAFYAIGAHASLGYSPFGIDESRRLVVLYPDGSEPKPVALESTPLARGYALLRELSPLILEKQAAGPTAIAAAWLNPSKPAQHVELGDYTLQVKLRRNGRTGQPASDVGYALVLALAPDEYLIAGTDVEIIFSPRTPGAPIAGIADAEEGSFASGHWIAGRKMSGDDIMLGYHLADDAAVNQSGCGLRFGADGPTLQRVKLYRYR